MDFPRFIHHHQRCEIFFFPADAYSVTGHPPFRLFLLLSGLNPRPYSQEMVERFQFLVLTHPVFLTMQLIMDRVMFLSILYPVVSSAMSTHKMDWSTASTAASLDYGTVYLLLRNPATMASPEERVRPQHPMASRHPLSTLVLIPRWPAWPHCSPAETFNQPTSP